MTIETRDDTRRVCQLWEWTWSSFGSDELSKFGTDKLYRMHFVPVVCCFRTYGIELKGWPRDYL